MRVQKFVSGGTTRCVQAAFRMVVHTLTGRDPGAEEADRMTGYVEGRGTWQFRMLEALAAFDLTVVDHEKFEVAQFIRDPEASIREQVSDPAVVRAILDESDLGAETASATRCNTHPRIRFVNATPTLADLSAELAKGALLMCSVNQRLLQQLPGREGHMLIVETVGAHDVVVDDPRPDGGLGVAIPLDCFLRAWRSPSPEMANLISVSRGR